MSSLELPSEERLSTGDLIAELTSRAPEIGPNSDSWPGLTVYRYIAPTAPQWDEVRSLSLCVVAQGRKRVMVGGRDYFYDPFHYLVFIRGQRCQAEILEASVEKPFLSLVLQIDPAIVRRVSSDMLDRATTTFHRPAPAQSDAPVFVSPVDLTLTGVLLRFLRSINTGADRRVLAPMYLQELTYRLLQAEQCSRLLAAASTEHEANPVSEVIRYVQDRMCEPVTVRDLADHVAMSPSAFAHLFREVTGMSPYQFVKGMRLDRARTLLVEANHNVGEVAREVGYTSLSHFINEFKRHFGMTPRAYSDLQRHHVALQVHRATSRAD